MTNKNIQPALISSASEYFTVSEPIHKLCNGNTIVINQLPADFSSLIYNEIEKEKSVKRSLLKIGITDKEEQIKKYYECNYSSFDEVPDVTEEGQLGPREYVQCNQRSVCPVEGILCHRPKNLTSRQVEVAIRIAHGEQDDKISAELFISKHTLRKHKNNIEVKIGLTGKPSMAAWAVKNKLV